MSNKVLFLCVWLFKLKVKNKINGNKGYKYWHKMCV